MLLHSNKGSNQSRSCNEGDGRSVRTNGQDTFWETDYSVYNRELHPWDHSNIVA